MAELSILTSLRAARRCTAASRGKLRLRACGRPIPWSWATKWCAGRGRRLRDRGHCAAPQLCDPLRAEPLRSHIIAANVDQALLIPVTCARQNAEFTGPLSGVTAGRPGPGYGDRFRRRRPAGRGGRRGVPRGVPKGAVTRVLEDALRRRPRCGRSGTAGGCTTLVSGNSGVGKSTLIRGHRPLAGYPHGRDFRQPPQRRHTDLLDDVPAKPKAGR